MGGRWTAQSAGGRERDGEVHGGAGGLVGSEGEGAAKFLGSGVEVGQAAAAADGGVDAASVVAHMQPHHSTGGLGVDIDGGGVGVAGGIGERFAEYGDQVLGVQAGNGSVEQAGHTQSGGEAEGFGGLVGLGEQARA